MAKRRITQLAFRTVSAPGTVDRSHVVIVERRGDRDVLAEHFSDMKPGEFHEIPVRVVAAKRQRRNASKRA